VLSSPVHVTLTLFSAGSQAWLTSLLQPATRSMRYASRASSTQSIANELRQLRDPARSLATLPPLQGLASTVSSERTGSSLMLRACQTDSYCCWCLHERIRRARCTLDLVLPTSGIAIGTDTCNAHYDCSEVTGLYNQRRHGAARRANVLGVATNLQCTSHSCAQAS
jgi:hypothetical protein